MRSSIIELTSHSCQPESIYRGMLLDTETGNNCDKLRTLIAPSLLVFTFSLPPNSVMLPNSVMHSSLVTYVQTAVRGR